MSTSTTPTTVSPSSLTISTALETLAMARTIEERRATLTLTPEEDDILTFRQWQLLHAAAEMTTLAVTEHLTALDATGAAPRLRQATTRALADLQSLQSAAEITHAAARAADLAAAILTGNPAAVAAIAP
ncbi:MAG: hypothetical protein ACT4PL_03340 [Phycisphaerales bacterium]